MRASAGRWGSSQVCNRGRGNEGVHIEPLQRLSVLAALTGLLLAGLVAIQLWAGLPRSDTLLMLLAAVLGFDLFLFAQDLRRKVRRRRG